MKLFLVLLVVCLCLAEVSRADVSPQELADKKAEILDEFCKDDTEASNAMLAKVHDWCKNPPSEVTRAFCKEVAKYDASDERQLIIRLGVLCFW